MAIRGGHGAMLKLEGRIRELEHELGSAQLRSSDVNNRLRKSERHYREIQLQQQTERQDRHHMTTLVDKLEKKLQSYKQQIEEAEEIAALNLAKFRQAQAQLGESEERADLNEQALAKYKAKERAASIGPMVSRNFPLMFKGQIFIKHASPFQ